MKNSHIFDTLRGLDIIALLAAGLFAYWLRLGGLPMRVEYILALSGISIGYVILGQMLGLYADKRIRKIFSQCTRAGLTLCLTFLGLFSIFFLVKTGAEFSRLWAGYWFVSAGVLLMFNRIMFQIWVKHLVHTGRLQKRIALVGTEDILAILTYLLIKPQNSIHAIYMLENDVALKTAIQKLTNAPIYTTAETFTAAMLVRQPDAILICKPMNILPLTHVVVETLRSIPCVLAYVLAPTFWSLPHNHNKQISGLPIVLVSEMPLQGRGMAIKRGVDITLSGIGIVIGASLLWPLALIIKRDGGPIFYKQARNGFNGEIFEIYKFRSMAPQPAGTAFIQATKNDPRITRIGKILRKTSMDELPQLINVWKGDMSLIGPRPHEVSHNAQFENLVDLYAARNRIRPGITGWAQVNGWRGETETTHKMAQRVKYDMDYIENWSLGLDLKIALLTPLRLFGKYIF